jgi:membrane protein EpsK
MKSAGTVSPGTIEASSLSQKEAAPDVARNRFAMNVGTNLAYVVVNTLLMVWYVPFLVRHLGVAAYGMIPLANSLVMYASIVSASLDVSISRYLAIDLNQGKEDHASRTFNSALVLSLIACAVLLIPAAIVTFLYPMLFDVPAGMERETQFLFASVVLTVLLAILSGVFGVSTLIKHRFDLRNIVRMIVSLSRIGIVVLCFTAWFPSLWWVAVAFIVSACFGLIGDVVLWRTLTPQLGLDYRNVDRRQFRALLNLSGWASINQIGSLLLMQIDLLVVNAFFGAEMTGRYGSIMLFTTLILTMTSTVVGVLSPAIMARYAVEDFEGLRRIAIRSVKLLGVGLALPVGLLCGLGAPLLTLWLGADFADLDVLLTLLVGHFSVNLAVRPLLYILTAYNRVRVQALLTLVLGVGNLALAIALASWGGWGAAGIAAAAALVWTVKNVLFLSSYCARVMGLRWWTFYAPLVPAALGTLGVAVAGRQAAQFWWPSTWLELAIVMSGIAAVYAVLAFAISLNRADRSLLFSILGRKLNV